MTLVEAIKAGRSHPFALSGRASRSEYWYWILFEVVAFVAMVFTVGFAAAAIGIYQEFLLLLMLTAQASALCAGVRRLHDLGKSGWFLLIVLVPFLGALYLLYLFTKHGEQSENQFGAPRP